MDGAAPSLAIAFSAGFLSFVSPCVLPLVPAYVSYVTGLSLEELTRGEERLRVKWRTLQNALLFIAGFSTVFILFGASATVIGQLLLTYQRLRRGVDAVRRPDPRVDPPVREHDALGRTGHPIAGRVLARAGVAPARDRAGAEHVSDPDAVHRAAHAGGDRRERGLSDRGGPADHHQFAVDAQCVFDPAWHWLVDRPIEEPVHEGPSSALSLRIRSSRTEQYALVRCSLRLASDPS